MHPDDDYDVLHPSEHSEPDQDGPALLPCPHCLGVMYEESVRCPHCGLYLSDEDQPVRKPWWVIVGALICLAVAIYWIIP